MFNFVRTLRCPHFLFFYFMGLLDNILMGGLQGIFNLANTAKTNRTNAQIATQTNLNNRIMNAQNNATNERIQQGINDTNVAINDATNEANYKIAQEANALNYKMMQEQNDWNLNMWNLQNEYNTPAAQMERLAEAGINPNMAAGTSVATGNAGSPAEGADWTGAQTATMNPVRLDASLNKAAHDDPYSLIPANVDFLGAISQAAGIDNVQADTKIKDITAEFKPQEFSDEHDMKMALVQHYLEQAKDTKLTRRGRIQMTKALTDLYKANEKSMKEELDMRKDAFGWAKNLRPYQLAQMEADLQKTFAEIDKMSAEEVLMKAQERHWINEDEYNKEMLNINQQNADSQSVLAGAAATNARTNSLAQKSNALYQSALVGKMKFQMRLEKVDLAFKAKGMKAESRKRLSDTLIRNGEIPLGQLIGGIKGARDNGSFTPIWKSFWSDDVPFVDQTFIEFNDNKNY